MPRVQMEMPKASHERLVRLKDRVEAASYAEVMQEALRLYEYLVEQEDDGGRFFIQEKSDEEPHRLKIFL